MEVPLRGVKHRGPSGPPYFETRYSGRSGNGKFYSTKIKSEEEGALCYDFAQRYSELETGSNVGGKRRAAAKLNYPEYSRSLQLEPLPSDFDIRCNKEAVMEIILRQAQAAAKNLPESLKRSSPVVDCPSPINRCSSHQNGHGKRPRVSEVKQDLPGVCTNIEVQKLFQEISELSHQCNLSYSSKVIEKEELERKVAGIKEDSGIIPLPKPGPDKFQYHMACFKRLISRDEKIPWSLEAAEQGYKSEESTCLELRKILEDHNLESIAGSLMGDGNRMAGRQRANEKERLGICPEVLEICPPEEKNEFSLPVDVSECYGSPASSLVVVRPCGTDTTMVPAEMDMSQGVVPYEVDKFADEKVETVGISFAYYPVHAGFRREEERLLEASSCSNAFSWTDLLYADPIEFSHEDPIEFSHEDPIPFQDPFIAPGCG